MVDRAEAERLLARFERVFKPAPGHDMVIHAKDYEEARAAVLAAMTVPPCSWSYDDWDCKWDSACGEAYQFMDGGPTENSYKHCPNCGGSIMLAAAPEVPR